MPKFDPEEKFDFKFVPIGIVAPNIVEIPNPNLPTGALNAEALVFWRPNGLLLGLGRFVLLALFLFLPALLFLLPYKLESW